MHRVFLLLAALSLVPDGLAQPGSHPEGSAPVGWLAARGDDGRLAARPSLPGRSSVLEFSGAASLAAFHRADVWLGNGFVEVRWKTPDIATAARVGLLWRGEDLDNYSFCLTSISGDRVQGFRMTDGQVSNLEGAALRPKGSAPFSRGKWHTIRVEFRSRRFEVFIDGRKRFQGEDTAFADPGGVGLVVEGTGPLWFEGFRWGILPEPGGVVRDKK
jgi:hypothetical protein